jgi:hypothetical protein
MMNTTKLRSFALLVVFFCVAMAAMAQQNCPMGMETHFVPPNFPTMSGYGICHLRLWDSDTAWINLETSNGVYNWSSLDTMLSEAQTLNSDVLYTFGKTPGWASSNPTDPNCTDGYHDGDCAPPSDVNTGDNYFKAFVSALVAHVGTQITYYEMWNEPYNLPYWDGTPQELEIMVADAAAIIRAANPNAIIITPSISTWANQQVFLQQFLTACQGNVSFDVFGIHDYTWGGPAEAVVARVQSAINFQKAVGLQALPLWGTEGSDKYWSTFTQQEKNDYVARYYSLELNMGSLRHYWYSWDVATVGELMNTPAATVYQTVGTWYDGRNALGCKNKKFDGGYEYQCTLQDTTDSSEYYVMWATNGSTTFATKASTYMTDMGVVTPVVGGSVPISDSPVLIQQ